MDTLGSKGLMSPSERTSEKPSSTSRAETREGPHLTKTQRQIIDYLRAHRGEPCSKAQIARDIGRNAKTVDRLLSQLRRDGLVVSEACHSESGAQLPNLYRCVEG